MGKVFGNEENNMISFGKLYCFEYKDQIYDPYKSMPIYGYNCRLYPTDPFVILEKLKNITKNLMCLKILTKNGVIGEIRIYLSRVKLLKL